MIGGTFGSRRERCAVVTPSTRSLPARTCGMAVAKSATITCTRPAIRSTSACGLALYCTPTIATLPRRLIVSIATSEVLLACA